jgi:acetyl-CoA synthetase
VGKSDEISGQAIFAFVTLRTGQEPSDALGVQLREHVAYVIGPIARPRYLMFTPDLPKTRSGKIMRRLLRDIAEGRILGDTTTLADATVVEAIRENTGKAED